MELFSLLLEGSLLNTTPLFPIFNLWPLTLDCICVMWQSGGGGVTEVFEPWWKHGTDI